MSLSQFMHARVMDRRKRETVNLNWSPNLDVRQCNIGSHLAIALALLLEYPLTAELLFSQIAHNFSKSTYVYCVPSPSVCRMRSMSVAADLGKFQGAHLPNIRKKPRQIKCAVVYSHGNQFADVQKRAYISASGHLKSTIFCQRSGMRLLCLNFSYRSMMLLSISVLRKKIDRSQQYD